MVSYFSDHENEDVDIGGSYLFGERDFDNTSSTFGQIINPLGAGFYQNYSRNSLGINDWNFSHKGSLEEGTDQPGQDNKRIPRSHANGVQPDTTPLLATKQITIWDDYVWITSEQGKQKEI